MYRVILTKQFTKCLRDLIKKGKKGKDAMMKARAAQSEAAEKGEITLVQHTKHGESRLTNVEKFDLGDGYRLVVQIVEPSTRQRAFLFVGDHEDADAWLDNHKNYRWVKRDDDSTLDFVQVSEPDESPFAFPSVDVESPESLLELPLLRDITDEEWRATHVPKTAVEYLKGVTANSWEQDPNGILQHVEGLTNTTHACFAGDVLNHAHMRQWNELHRRFEVSAGTSTVVEGTEAAKAMVATVNSEQFVTWEDVADLPIDADWADWMLFLHPEQKDLAFRDFNGPTRLRGVSGSGKTCVMVHRARYLAKKYHEDILLVTLTESTKRLLELLVKLLCGAESAHIKISTMNKLAMDTIEALAPDGLRSFTMSSAQQDTSNFNAVLDVVRSHPVFGETVLAKLTEGQLESFVRDEIEFVRMRLRPAEYDKYYMTIVRHGRVLPLPEKARAVMLAAVKAWDQGLLKYRVKDHEGVVQTAISLLSESTSAARRTFRFRCVLVDEVQDLSQLEMRILSRIPDSTGKPVVDLADGLFLVGDGAQTIYRKGFSLKQCGVSVANRSLVLKKNYRNTREILQAAYGLIETYEFSDVDEENVQTPTAPDLSSRHGEKPFIVKCANHHDESAFVVGTIRELIKEQQQRDESAGLESATEIPICVIGFTTFDRQRIDGALKKARIPSVELRSDVTWSKNAVKMSTLESAKGHEFHAVFIVGICQGTMPSSHVEQVEWKREAARLYVGMTRARDRLYLSYDVGGRNGPSEFLAAIQDNCQECTFKNGSLVPE